MCFHTQKRTTWGLHFSGTERRKQTHRESAAETNPRTPAGKRLSRTPGWHRGKFCHLLARPGFLAPGRVPQPTRFTFLSPCYASSIVFQTCYHQCSRPLGRGVHAISQFTDEDTGIQRDDKARPKPDGQEQRGPTARVGRARLAHGRLAAAPWQVSGLNGQAAVLSRASLSARTRTEAINAHSHSRQSGKGVLVGASDFCFLGIRPLFG